MLREVPEIRQEVGHLTKRWFSSARMDLFLWYDEGNRPVRFQLCYGKGTPRERAVTWRRGTGLCYHEVDDGERTGVVRRSPTLQATTEGADLESARHLFRAEAQQLEPAIVELVAGILQQAGD